MEVNAMTITFRLLEAYLKCATKCWLKANGEQPSSGSYAGWAQAQNEAYRAARIHELLSKICQQKSLKSPSVGALRGGSWRLATEVLAQTKNVESCLPAVERVQTVGPGKPAQLIPLRFIYTNKLERDAKVLLAFDALALAQLGFHVAFGKIMHGDENSVAKVRVSALASDVQNRIEEMTALLSRTSPPDLRLIRHCGECEFQDRCPQKLLEKD